jgi:hypothetical protein
VHCSSRSFLTLLLINAFVLLRTVLWGLDADGTFRTKAADATSLWGRLKERLFKKDDVNVRETVLMDIRRIHESVQAESKALRAADASRHEIGKKLLFLFQCDLLPGISGKILELKGSRDSTKVKHVPKYAKIAGYTVLFLMNTGMMFYILLFALTQTGPRQNAWFQSFALWLVVEILLVSTGIVFVTHILIPSLVMKDITQIKRRLMDNIRDFNDKVAADKANGKAILDTTEDSQKVSFNAANFLFVSTRLARQFPDLKESKIIAQFSTPWPRQSYLRVQNVSKKYSKKFSALTRSASILLIFFVGNFLSVPPSIQDMVVQMTSTTAIGYIVLVHVQLYEIFPALVVLPALLLAGLAHFVIQSSKSDAKMKLARLFPARRKVAPTVSCDAASVAHGSADAVYAIPLDDERKESDSDFELSDLDTDSDGQPTAGAMVVAHSAVHRTRRQSLAAGLDVINALRAKHTGPGNAHNDAVSSRSSDRSYEFGTMDSDSSALQSSAARGKSRTESEELHVRTGTPQSTVRVLARKRLGSTSAAPAERKAGSSSESGDISDSSVSTSSSDGESSDSGSESDDCATVSSISLHEDDRSAAREAATESSVASGSSSSVSGSTASSAGTTRRNSVPPAHRAALASSSGDSAGSSKRSSSGGGHFGRSSGVETGSSHSNSGGEGADAVGAEAEHSESSSDTDSTEGSIRVSEDNGASTHPPLSAGESTEPLSGSDSSDDHSDAGEFTAGVGAPRDFRTLEAGVGGAVLVPAERDDVDSFGTPSSNTVSSSGSDGGSGEQAACAGQESEGSDGSFDSSEGGFSSDLLSEESDADYATGAAIAPRHSNNCDGYDSISEPSDGEESGAVPQDGALQGVEHGTTASKVKTNRTQKRINNSHGSTVAQPRVKPVPPKRPPAYAMPTKSTSMRLSAAGEERKRQQTAAPRK